MFLIGAPHMGLCCFLHPLLIKTKMIEIRWNQLLQRIVTHTQQGDTIIGENKRLKSCACSALFQRKKCTTLTMLSLFSLFFKTTVFDEILKISDQTWIWEGTRNAQSSHHLFAFTSSLSATKRKNFRTFFPTNFFSRRFDELGPL